MDIRLLIIFSQFVGIQEHQVGAFQSVTVQGDAFLLGVHDEEVHDALHLGDNVGFLDVQAGCVVLQLVEVEQLVDESQHSIHAPADDVQQQLVVLVDAFTFAELFHWSRNHGEWCSELMRDVSEETHVHLVDALFLLLLILSLLNHVLLDADAHLLSIDHEADAPYYNKV